MDKQNNNIDPIKDDNNIDNIHLNMKQGLYDILQDSSMGKNVVNQINEFLQTGNPFTKGSEGEIYKVPVKTDIGLRYFLIAKKRYDEDTKSEYEKHKRILDIIETSSTDNKGKIKNERDNIGKNIGVPKLYGHWDTHDNNLDNNYIIMEYIPGKTFFAAAAEKIIQSPCKDDSDAFKQLKKHIFHKEKKDVIQDGEIYNYVLDMIRGGKVKIFNESDGFSAKINIKNFLNIIHQKGFFHRDLGDNLRNIILGDDGKIYIIDFGKSKMFKGGTTAYGNDDDVYSKDTTVFGENKYPQDEAILSFVDLLTNKPPKKEPREL